MALLSRKKAEAPGVIDLREPRPTKPLWGSPMPCPACSGRGYLDHIDPYKEIMFLHCTAVREPVRGHQGRPRRRPPAPTPSPSDFVHSP